ncbi:hypothetical protein MUP37_02295 [Candidatus Bathyarchaeota archaeon]|nr:hypothetical protein [Candidatus Bathyarchaeota archaeon]
MSGTHDPRRRGPKGLLPQQEEFLHALVRLGSWKEALKATGFTQGRVWRWQKVDPVFNAAYDEAQGKLGDIARKAIEGASFDAVRTVTDAQGARKPLTISVTCPFCHKGFKETVRVDDWGIRLRASEMILKGGGVIVDKKRIEVDVLQLTFPERLALLMAQNDPNANVPPYMLTKFKELGLLPAGEAAVVGEIIEGEFKDVTDEVDSA